MLSVLPSPGGRVTVAGFLDSDIGKVSEWCDLRGMKLNATKTMIVSRSQTMHPHSAVRVVGKVKQFCYLGVMLDCGGWGCRKSQRARIGASRGKLTETKSPGTQGIPLPQGGKVYESCIRSVMLYGVGDIGSD